MNVSRGSGPLNLRAGELVEVRGKAEILATLDSKGCLDALPFMPEMFAFCGRQYRVFKRAHKTCDTIDYTGGRRMHGAVHLKDIRCDGQGHGGCQAGCLIFWKEVWLKRVVKSTSSSAPGVGAAMVAECTEGDVWTNAYTKDESANAEPVYSCQATRLRDATTAPGKGDWKKYWEDYSSGNVGLWRMLKVAIYANYSLLIWRSPGWFRRILYWIFYGVRILCGKPPIHPRSAGMIPAGERTPDARLDLQVGEIVRVKSFAAILQTIDKSYKNRGMKFDAEMTPYCGGTYTVRERVHQIIDEKTGRMLNLQRPCIVLDGVVCQSIYSNCRYFCPRSIFAYWREIWLERVSSGPGPASGHPDSVK